LHGNWEISWLAVWERTVRTGKAGGPKSVMHGHEKSGPSIVASRTNAEGRHRGKPANEEESVERRACPGLDPGEGAEGNAIGHGKRRTLSRESLSHGLDRVREAAKRDDQTYTALLHHIDVELLKSAYGLLRKAASAGVDGVSWEEYGEGL